MRGEREFLVDTAPLPSNKPKAHERAELAADISVFSPATRPVVEKLLSGDILTPEELRIFETARNTWWFDKYGFPHEQKAARTEVLMQKYATTPEISEAKILQARLFETLKSKDRKSIDVLKKEYEEKYPDQLEGVEALFYLIPFFETQKRLSEHKEIGEKRRQMIEETTQYQFLLTHFIAQNSGDKQFLKLFWEVAEKAAKETDNLIELNRMRRGVLSQVAVYKILDAIGAHPTLSHPKEDAFHAIDLWAEDQVVQIKGFRSGEPQLIETDTVSFPGTAVTRGDEVHHFDAYLTEELKKFRAKVLEYGKMTGKKLRGFLIQIPYHKFDFVTGEPSKDVIEFVRKNLPQPASSETKK